jgi:hypothetical protein
VAAQGSTRVKNRANPPHKTNKQQKIAKNAKKFPNFIPKIKKTAVCNYHVNFLTPQRSAGCAFIPLESANEQNIFALAYFAFDLFRKLPKVTDDSRLRFRTRRST